MLVTDPGGEATSSQLHAGPDDGLAGATAISVPPDGTIWAAYEQAGSSLNLFAERAKLLKEHANLPIEPRPNAGSPSVMMADMETRSPSLANASV